VYQKKLDIVVISDVHLGTKDAHATELLDYLKQIDPKILILNGDMVELRNSGQLYFPKEHLSVVQQIIYMSNAGTEVYFITGNLEECLRYHSEISFGNIHMRDKLILGESTPKTHKTITIHSHFIKKGRFKMKQPPIAF